MSRLLIMTWLLALTLAAPGCMSVVRSFPEHTPEEVWTAMNTVADSPEYDDWMLSGNAVWVDPASNRLEIDRHLKRYLHRPGSQPIFQTRNFRFRITLEDLQPPTVRFTSRGFNIPMHAHSEAIRYFADLRALLAGESPRPDVGPMPAAPPAAPPSAPAPDPSILDEIGRPPAGGSGAARR